MRLYNLLTRTGDFIAYGLMGVLGIDAVRHLFSGGEQNYQIVALEMICALGIGASKYLDNKKDEWKENLRDDVREMQRRSLSFIARTDQLTAEWRDRLEDLGDYLEDISDDL